MDTSTGTRKLEDRARDILKGIGIQPNAAYVHYVTEQLATLVEYSIEFALEQLKNEGRLKEVKKPSSINGCCGHSL